jgi:RNA polymerase sigma-70 factor (ECF subfamily)
MAAKDRPTSLTLLERARNRDNEAWHRLVHLYAPLVTSWCERSGLQGQDSDDVCQDVFGAVAAHLDTFRRDRPGDTFRGWLRTITRNKLLDHFRRRQNQAEAQGGTDAQRQLQQVAEQPWPDDSEQDLGALYRRALELVRGEFEAQTWEAFWRVAVEGHACAAIAADLGVTEGAIRKAKSRVLHRLRQEIGDLAD